MAGNKHYRLIEINEILNLKKSGWKIKDIAKQYNRTENGISGAISRYKDAPSYKAVYNFSDGSSVVRTADKTVLRSPLKDYTYDELIKYLYDQGFRIEDNQLIHITKTPVKLNNITN